MAIDESLKSYALEHLLRADPRIDRHTVEAYVASEDFKILISRFDINMELSIGRFAARPANPGSDRAGPATTALRALALDAQPMSFNALSPSKEAEHDESPSPKSPAPPVPPVTTIQPPPAQPAAQPAPLPISKQEPELADITFRVPNARAGEAYVQKIEPINAPAGGVVFDEFALPHGLQMLVEKDTGTLSGTANSAGEHSVSFTYRFGREPLERKRRGVVKLTVNPDPKTMWKDLSSNRQDVYWKPDEECRSVKGRELRIIAASKRGRSHAHVGSFRDDHFQIDHIDESGWYIAVVSDGAGSARFSRQGAAIICEEAMNKLRGTLTGQPGTVIDSAAASYYAARTGNPGAPEVDALRQTLRTTLSGVVGNAAYYAAKGVLDESVRRKDELNAVFKDYSSTALISICKRYSFGTLCAAYWVGDGAVAIYSKKDGVILLGDVDSGEYSGQTRFLDSSEVTQEALIKRTRFEIVDDMTALVLMTDGVSDPKFETDARLARPADWHDLWNDLDRSVGLSRDGDGTEQKLLAWLDFWSQGNHDDRTIALIY
jgi:hypothetical protein